VKKKKQPDRTYSVIVVSDATAQSRSFAISGKTIRNALWGLGVLGLLFAYMVFDYLSISYSREKMQRLEADNHQKAKTIATLEGTVGDLQASLTRMNEFKERIMVASGLKSPFALREVGRGGDATAEEMSGEMSGQESFSGALPQGGLPQQIRPIGPTTPPASGLVDQARGIRQQAMDIESALKRVNSVIDMQKLRLACMPSIWPTRGYITDGFGPRIHPLTGKKEFHPALDISTQLGNPILAPAKGIVLVAEHQRFMGNMIIIDHGFGYTTRYGHLSEFNVREGDQVQRGDIIGKVGNTGRSSAPHLHYEVRLFDKPVNPLDFMID